MAYRIRGWSTQKKWDMGEDVEFLAKVHHTPAAYTDDGTTKEQKEMLYTIALANQLAEYTGKSYYKRPLYSWYTGML